MKRILVPTDFSENAMHAAQYAATLARCYEANIVFLNIYTLPIVFEYKLISHMNTDMAQMQKIAELNLTDFVSDFMAKTNFTSERISQIAEYGLIGENIIRMAESSKIDMIVMGTKGASNLLESWLGTNAQKVGKNARCPVWIIPQNAKLEYPQNILYAADFEEDETKPIQKLLDIATPLGATCKVVHVHEYFEPNVGHAIEHTIADLKKKFKSKNITFKEIDRPDIVNGLEKYISGYMPDVLAFAMHEKSIMAKIFETSISKHFIQTANLPMLMLGRENV